MMHDAFWGELEKEIRALPQNVLNQTHTIIEILENDSFISGTCHSMAQRRAFYRQYAIELFEENIRDEHHVELMLASCGLLAGYDGTASLEGRRKKYADAIAGTNSGDSEDEVRKASQRAYKQEKQIIDELMDSLTGKIDAEGHLNAAEKIINKLLAKFNGVIPETLPLPEPRFTQNAIMQKNKWDHISPQLPSTDYRIEVKMRIKGDKAWHNSLENVNIGDRIEHLIRYVNTSGEDLMDIIYHSGVPDILQCRPGSAVLFNSEHKEGVPIQDIPAKGAINLGSCKNGDEVSVVYETSVLHKIQSDVAVGQGEIEVDKKILPIQTRLTLKCGWGPERPLFTNESPATYAVFNSIKNNAAVGDERDFVRIVEKNTGKKYVSDLEIEAGKQYEVYIYYQNDASETYNDAKHNYIGVARGVRVSTSFPLALSKGEAGAINGKIKADNTNPLVVWDGARVRARESMTLHYVEGSAKIYNGGPTNGSVLSTKLFSEEGTLIGYSELRGIILGGDLYSSGHIIYTIQTQAVKEQ